MTLDNDIGFGSFQGSGSLGQGTLCRRFQGILADIEQNA